MRPRPNSSRLCVMSSSRFGLCGEHAGAATTSPRQEPSPAMTCEPTFRSLQASLTPRPGSFPRCQHSPQPAEPAASDHPLPMCDQAEWPSVAFPVYCPHLHGLDIG